MSTILNSLRDPELIRLLNEGKVGVIPTDTVYGLVCRAADEKAVGRLYAAKLRDDKPGTVIAASTEQLVTLGIKARYLKPVEMYWPNPISIIIPSFDLKYIHLGKGSIAMRVIADNELATVLRSVGPLLTTSANLPGEQPANTLQQARDYFGTNIDFYVDGGDMSGREPSTVMRVVDDAVEVLREGAVTISESGEIVT